MTSTLPRWPSCAHRLKTATESLTAPARARTKRLEQLVAAVNHHKQLVTFAAELRDAIGAVEPGSELGRWLEWIGEYIKDADVLERFRNRQPTLTLYCCASTYAAEGIVKNGFDSRGPEHGEDQELPASVALTDVPMEGIFGGTVCVLIEVPEETALPYESVRDNKTYRRFRMPAEISNRFERRKGVEVLLNVEFFDQDVHDVRGPRNLLGPSD